MSRRLVPALSLPILVALGPLAAAADAPGWRLVAPQGAAEAVLRAAPDPAAAPVETLAAGELVVADGAAEDAADGRWLRLARPDRPDGWLSAAELAPALWRGLGDSDLPAAGVCGGVEPMWSLRWTEAEAVLETPQGARTLPAPTAADATGGGPAQLLVAGADPDDRLLLLFENGPCTAWPLDGLVWGAGALVLDAGGAPGLLRGCCRPAAEAFAPGP